jgi:hypothetical protein
MGAADAILAALVLAGQSGAGEAGDSARPAKVVVVALAGRLSREEIESEAAAGARGSAGSNGVILERVAFALPDEDRRVEALRAALIPPGPTVVALRYGEGGGLGAPPPDAVPPSPQLREIQAHFGAPPPLDPREIDAVLRLRRAAGGPSTPRRAANGEAALDAVRFAQLTLIVIEAPSDAAEDVRRRRDAIRDIRDTAGAGAHVIVALIPQDGPGRVIAHGPLFRPGHVITSEKTSGVVTAAVRRILGGQQAEKKDEPDESAELFRS